MIKNSSIRELFKLQEHEFHSCERKAEINQNSSQENMLSANLENKEACNQNFNADFHIVIRKNDSLNRGDEQTVDSFMSLVLSGANIQSNTMLPDGCISKLKKKRKYRL